MKKYFLLLGCSLIAAGAAVLASADDGLKAVKDLYLKEFQSIDTDSDGKISQQEFLSHRFNSLRANIIDAEGFDADENTSEVSSSSVNPASSATPTSVTPENIVGVPSALSDMANYKLEDEDDLLKEEPIRLTKEDVMPESEVQEPVEELDLSISEEESLRQLMEGVENKPVAEETEEVAEVSEKQETPIQFMLDTIKKTLPKKIDEITTWVDITYNNNVIDYIYKAEIDTSTYSADEVKVLKNNIQKEACTKAYSDMCPRIKPMFIDKGIDMRIIYLDKADEQISACEFNKITCNE